MKIGVIGTGSMARKVAADWQNRCPESLYAVSSRSIDKAEAMAEQFGFLRAYGSAAELVIDEAVDIIYVAAPRLYYYDLARLALEHGKPIFFRRSFAASEAQADVLEQLARERGLSRMMMDLQSFFIPE